MKDKITVLFSVRKITILYSMYPFWVSAHRGRFHFTTDLDWVIKTDKNRKLLLVGWFQGQDRDGSHKQLLTKLRQKYDKVSYFDDNDGSESHFLDLLPFFDTYYKKQVFRNRSLYAKDFYGKRIFTDFYHKELGIDENPTPESLPALSEPEHLDRMKVLWNLAFGQYPGSKNRHSVGAWVFKFFGPSAMQWVVTKRVFGVIPNPTIPKCQARFGYGAYRPLVGYQRKLLLEITKKSNKFLSGKIPVKAYNAELRDAKAILSPFGWGEVCFRDFEAILNGCVLVKPDMSHIETWPDVFIPHTSYVPIRWDGSDLLEVVDNIFQDQSMMDAIRTAAWEIMRNSYDELDERVLMLWQDFQGK